VIDKVISHLEGNLDSYTERLFDLLRIPSISTDPEHAADMEQAAQWLQRVFAACGVKSEIVPTAGHPCVLADTGPTSEQTPTVLVYGHYDVQPVGDESLWDSPAFEPTMREGLIYARGAADDKGQLLAHVLAVEAWRQAVGELPVRVKFLLEGEEEIGSAHLGDVLRERVDQLACDYVAISDTAMFDARTPAITYGTKGMVYKEIVLHGPKHDVHSGAFGGTIANPGNTLASIIAQLHDEQNRVTIPGFYDAVRPLTPEERAAMKELAFDEEEYRASLGVPALEGEEGYTTLERQWARPTLDVNGLYGGFTGTGGSTIIPARAAAKVSMRIVPDQDPEAISAAFDRAVEALTPPGVRLEIKQHAAAHSYLCPLDSAGIRAASAALELGFGKQPVFIRSGGTLPILALFKQELGADSLLMGFCTPDCNAHGPNEFLALGGFQRGIRMAAHFVDRLAQTQ